MTKIDGQLRAQQIVFETEQLLIHVLSFVPVPLREEIGAESETTTPVTIPRFSCIELLPLSGVADTAAVSVLSGVMVQLDARQMYLCAALNEMQGLPNFACGGNASNDLALAILLRDTAVACVGMFCPIVSGGIKKLLELRSSLFESTTDPVAAAMQLRRSAPTESSDRLCKKMQFATEILEVAVAEQRVIARFYSHTRKRAELGAVLSNDCAAPIVISHASCAQTNTRRESIIPNILAQVECLRDALSIHDWMSVNSSLGRVIATRQASLFYLAKHEIDEANDLLLDSVAKEAMCSALVRESTLSAAGGPLDT